MTMTTNALEFDLADRMRRTLRITGIDVLEMADYLGVSRNSVSAWINGRTTPHKQTLMLWADKTEVPLEWLLTGSAPLDGGAEVVRPEGFEPPAYCSGVSSLCQQGAHAACSLWCSCSCHLPAAAQLRRSQLGLAA